MASFSYFGADIYDRSFAFFKAFEAELRNIVSMKRDDRIYMEDVFNASSAANVGYAVKSEDLIEGLRDMNVVMRKIDGNGVKYYKFN